MSVELMSRRQAARYLGISMRSLDRLRHEGAIEVVRIRGRVLVRPESVQAFVTKQTHQGGGTT
jgi:excisionase family DNA binding protein